VRRGDVVVDVGCHKGGFLFWLRRYVAAEGRVYAFEPQPALAGYLDAIVRTQGWRNVVLERAALSSAPGSMMLYVPAAPGHSSPGATLAPASAAGAHHHVPVAVTTLDARVPAAERVSCIKCDCEGHELEVFQGAERILRQDRPVLLFECEGRHLSGYARTIADGGGRTPADVFAYLQARDYAGFFFSPQGLQPVERFRPEVHQPVRDGRFWQARDYCNNFLFVPTERNSSPAAR
jgi:FkbM family methyltransferase